MKQLNIAIDEQLHQDLVDIAAQQNRKIANLVRSGLRYLTPNMQSVTVCRLQDSGVPLPESTIEAEAKIVEFNMPPTTFWFGTLHISSSVQNLPFITESFPASNPDFSITLEDGRCGAARATMFTCDCNGSLVSFIGQTTLQEEH